MIADSSSAESGLIHIGDILLSVDGHGVAGNSIEDIIQMIRSQKTLNLGPNPKTSRLSTQSRSMICSIQVITSPKSSTLIKS